MNVLAVGVALEVHRAGRHQLAAAPKREKARRPAALGRGAVALLHGVQVGMAHEGGGRGLRGQQAVPGGGVDLGGGAVDADDGVGQGRAFRQRPRGPVVSAM